MAEGTLAVSFLTCHVNRRADPHSLDLLTCVSGTIGFGWRRISTGFSLCLLVLLLFLSRTLTLSNHSASNAKSQRLQQNFLYNSKCYISSSFLLTLLHLQDTSIGEI